MLPANVKQFTTENHRGCADLLPQERHAPGEHRHLRIVSGRGGLLYNCRSGQANQLAKRPSLLTNDLQRGLVGLRGA